MLLKMLGIMDIIAGLSAVLVGMDLVGARAGLAVLMYLTLKLLTFGLELFSVIDTLAGIVILIGVFVNIGLFFWVATTYILGKGLWSLT